MMSLACTEIALITRSTYSSQNAPNVVWRPGFAPLEELKRSHSPSRRRRRGRRNQGVAAIKEGMGEKRGEGWKGEEKGKETRRAARPHKFTKVGANFSGGVKRQDAKDGQSASQTTAEVTG